MSITQDMESQHTKALLGITFASLLLVAVKGSALLQYWQQTHHILLEFGGLPSASSYLPDTRLIKEWKRQWDNTQHYWSGVIDQSESRMLLAGQLLLIGEEALPKPELPVVMAPACPIAELIAEACPDTKPVAQTKPIAYATPTAAMTEAPAEEMHGQTIGAIDAATPITTATDVTGNQQEALGPLPEPTPEAIAAAQGPIPLSADDRILLVGDSLMQGLAPHLITSLKRKYHVESMDLSKHSTGLTYPAFFDWPATVEDAFELENYSVVIVFLGANDPWDMTIHGHYTRFGSEQWKTIYRERVARIINTAATHRARLVWLGVPPLGREDLIGKAPTLNAIYAEEAGKMPLFARFVATDPALTSDGTSFTKFLELPDRGSVMVRTDDGVHFTTQGHRLLANLALTQFSAGAAPADIASTPNNKITQR
ncbi:MAG: hypothetical protein K0Q67_1090 [Cellvibrio sp.]|nr:hypothetical protein [Cellvibrio sp.]